MPKIPFIRNAICIAIITASASSAAASPAMLVSPLVDHPVVMPTVARTTGNWRSGTGAWGESLATEVLRLRGFNEVKEIKSPGNTGIDRIAIKRSPTGKMLDAKFVEVKAGRSAKLRLGNTQYGGPQMSRKWLAENLKRMRSSGDPALKTLALEISRFRKQSRIPIERLGEVMQVNTKSGHVTGYAYDGRTIQYRESVERLLRNVQHQAMSAHGRDWAARNLAHLSQILATTMSDWLGKQVHQQSAADTLRITGRSSRSIRPSVLSQSRRALVFCVPQRAAGRFAPWVVLAWDAKVLADTEHAYQQGIISVRQRNVQVITTLGGMAGAFAGAKLGGATGAWLGSFGGPYIWITVPVGGTLGAMIGGSIGYFGGSAIAAYGANEWYDSIDESVKSKFELVWIGAVFVHE